MHYIWYEGLKRSNELQQGDFIPNCPIIIPPSELVKEGQEIDAVLQYIDTIVLSQSCDLVGDGKITNVLVSPYKSLKNFLEDLPNEMSETRKARENTINSLKQGKFPPYHILNKSEEFPLVSDYPVVDFRNVYAVNFQALKQFASQFDSRVRLLPPYREHLSQAFARFLMRVGLPQDFRIEGY